MIEYGSVQDALKTLAARSGGPVEGWTDRPTVAPELLDVWTSYLAFLHARDQGVGLGDWIDRTHWREPPDGRALLFGVFTELMVDRARICAQKAPPPKPGE